MAYVPIQILTTKVKGLDIRLQPFLVTRWEYPLLTVNQLTEQLGRCKNRDLKNYIKQVLSNLNSFSSMLHSISTPITKGLTQNNTCSHGHTKSFIYFTGTIGRRRLPHFLKKYTLYVLKFF